MTRRPDQIDWSALSHAYGSAEDIPEAIEALADPERVESAVDSFYDALLHQQSIYSATGPAVVAELSRQAQRDQRLSTMDAVGDEELLARMRRAVALLGDGAAVSGREP